jgi:tape measure domain-containing protein
MSKFAEAFVQIGANLDTGSFSAVKSKVSGAIGDIGSQATGRVRSALSGISGAITAAAGAIGAVEIGKFALGLAADAEQSQVAFEVMLGSAGRARQVLGELKDFAAATPFEFPELRDAARKLIAFGVSAEEVVPKLRQIGDVSSGIGAPIGEIAEIFGKAKVQGRLFMEDINQLTGRGIPVIQELAKQFGVSESKVRTLVEQGKVGFPQLEQAFTALTSTGGQFAGMMERSSTTLGGLWSTFADTMKNKLQEAAEVAVAAFDFKGMLQGMTEAGEKTNWLATGVTKLADVVDVVRDAFGFAQWAATAMFTKIASGIAYLLEVAAQLPSALGGDWFADAASGARAFSDSMQQAANTQWDEAMAAFNDKTPSERVKALAEEMANVSDATTGAAGAMAKVASETKRAADAGADLVTELKAQVETYGMTDRQKRIHEAAKKSDDPFAIEEAEKLDAELTAKEQQAEATKQAERKREQGMGEVSQIREQTRTPMEKYQEGLSHLQELRQQFPDQLDDETFNRRVQQLTDDTKREMGVDQPEEQRRQSQSSMVGLADYANQIQMSMMNNQDPTTAEVQKSNEILKQILERQKNTTISLAAKCS